ncbi:hypothetical protein N9L68_05770 [bacterium]|nr:hypothetical protein [bacterium]
MDLHTRIHVYTYIYIYVDLHMCMYQYMIGLTSISVIYMFEFGFVCLEEYRRDLTTTALWTPAILASWSDMNTNRGDDNNRDHNYKRHTILVDNTANKNNDDHRIPIGNNKKP